MINLSMAEPDNMLRPRISVVGVGGAGGNAINNMIRSNLEGCDFIAANTDAQALAMSLASRKLQLGVTLSRGLGAGSKPEIGRAAAEEQLTDILGLLEGSDMLFVTAGMGGGTGTGAAPVIARAARESGILTVGVVTKPFNFEGGQRMRQAEAGIAELQQYVDTLIVIPNQNLFRVANERTTFAEAFRMADEVLHSGVRGITDLMVMPGFMNLDFADVKTVMSEMGKAMMGTGEADGDNRALRAAEAAIANPLLDDISMKGARGVLINITGGLDMTLFEMDQAANRIKEEVDPDAQIKVGSTLGENLEGRIRVSIIATGIDAAMAEQQKSSSGTSTQKAPMTAKTTMQPQTQRLATSNETAMRRAPQSSMPNMGMGMNAAPASQPTHSAPAAQPSVSTASVNLSSSYFTMPSALTPQGMTHTHTNIAPPAPEREPEIDDSEDEAPMMSAAPEMQGRQDSAPMMSSPRMDDRAAPSMNTYQRQPETRMAEPRMAEPRIQEPRMNETRANAGMPQRTLNPVSARTKEEAADMRMTQLTASQPTSSAPASGHASQRAQSLFKRITGFGMIRPSATREEEEEEMEMQQAPVQARLDVDPVERQPMSSDASSDILDIPAFLRRQTNH